MQDPKPLLLAMFQAADPAACVKAALPGRPRGRTIVIGAGKASAAMARAVEEVWDGPWRDLS
jgi:glycerate 2-kinase